MSRRRAGRNQFSMGSLVTGKGETGKVARRRDVILSEADVILSEADVILSEAKDLMAGLEILGSLRSLRMTTFPLSPFPFPRRRLPPSPAVPRRPSPPLALE